MGVKPQIKYRVEVYRRYLSYRWEQGQLFDTEKEAEDSIMNARVFKQYPRNYRIIKEYVYYGA